MELSQNAMITTTMTTNRYPNPTCIRKRKSCDSEIRIFDNSRIPPQQNRTQVLLFTQLITIIILTVSIQTCSSFSFPLVVHDSSYNIKYNNHQKNEKYQWYLHHSLHNARGNSRIMSKTTTARKAIENPVVDSSLHQLQDSNGMDSNSNHIIENVQQTIKQDEISSPTNDLEIHQEEEYSTTSKNDLLLLQQSQQYNNNQEIVQSPAPPLSFTKYVTMQERRVVVTIRYTANTGLKPYCLTIAKKLKALYPDLIIEKKTLIPENPRFNYDPDDDRAAVFEICVDNKVIVGTGNSRGSGSYYSSTSSRSGGSTSGSNSRNSNRGNNSSRKSGNSGGGGGSSSSNNNGGNNNNSNDNSDSMATIVRARRSVFINMKELDFAIQRARRKKRPNTLYGEMNTIHPSITTGGAAATLRKGINISNKK